MRPTRSTAAFPSGQHIPVPRAKQAPSALCPVLLLLQESTYTGANLYISRVAKKSTIQLTTTLPLAANFRNQQHGATLCARPYGAPARCGPPGTQGTKYVTPLVPGVRDMPAAHWGIRSNPLSCQSTRHPTIYSRALSPSSKL